MEIPRAHNLWLPYATLAAALLLHTIALPGVAAYLAPEWMLLVLLYWVLAIPYRFGIFFSFCVGLVVDVYQGLPLGLNGLAYACVAYAVLVLHRRIRVYPPLQQAGMILFILCLYLIIKLTLRSLLGVPYPPTLVHLLPALPSAILWPFVYMLLRGLRIRYRVK
ncbi:MAG: rod shape-determining protein MreD [Natronospirillum sp.]